MIGFWSTFQLRANPNGPYVPEWPRFNRAEDWMSLKACDTAESSNEPPAACSQAQGIASLVVDHELDLWPRSSVEDNARGSTRDDELELFRAPS